MFSVRLKSLPVFSFKRIENDRLDVSLPADISIASVSDSYECAGLLLCKHLAHYPDEEGKSDKTVHSVAF